MEHEITNERSTSHREAHGRYPITDFRKQAYLEWLCTPTREREPKTLDALADQLQVTRRTLANWKNDVEFIEAWEKRYRKTIGNPEKKQRIMDTLLRTATDGDDPKHVQAAKTYFEIEGSLNPNKMDVVLTRPTKELSDEELEALIAGKAAQEQRARNQGAA